MRRIKELLRLKFQIGLTDRQIAQSCNMARSTVGEYVKRAAEAGLSWPLPEELNEEELEKRLFGKAGRTTVERATPDFKEVHEELRSNKNVTLQLLWEEYRQSNPEGYQYSQFCNLYREWTKHLDVVLRQPHKAGEKLFVDYAGPKVRIEDGHGGYTEASIFVAVMGASSYSYAEATAKQDLNSWIESHINTFEFLGGCPEIVVPDNLKAGVIRPCRYEPEINSTYAEMAAHYSVAIIPTRPRKPRDKAKVESGVLVVERWILAALRHRTFFSIPELNAAIQELIERLNQRRFRKLPGCRGELFATLDQPVLRPLPAERYSFAEWKPARVNIDYHVELDHHFYSVPYSLIRKKVELRYGFSTVEVFHQGVRVASHARSYKPGAATTVDEHRPECHRRYLEWTPSRLLEWAARAGCATQSVADAILQSRRHPEQSYRSCLGLIRLGDRYGQQRLEAACARALKFEACSYKKVKSILEGGLDRCVDCEVAQPLEPLVHDNVRGPDYFRAAKEVSHVD
jgi:transposase